MAVIVLKGADFSADNIGKIIFKKSLSKITETVLSRYGVTPDVDNPLHQATDHFIRVLSAKNIIGENGKIKNLCMPFLSANGDIAHAQINALTGNSFFDTTITESLNFVKGGLRPIVGQNVANLNLKSFYPSFPSCGLHFAGYNITDEAKSSDARWIFGNFGKALGLQKHGTNGNPIFMIHAQGDKRLEGDPKYGMSSCFIVANAKQDVATLFCNGQKTEKKNPTWYSESAWGNPPFGAYNGNFDGKYVQRGGMDTTTEASWALLSLGDALTDEESVIFNNEVGKLMVVVSNVFNV